MRSLVKPYGPLGLRQELGCDRVKGDTSYGIGVLGTADDGVGVKAKADPNMGRVALPSRA